MLIFPEYSLFRLLRPYLIMVAFIAAVAYCVFFNPAAAAALLASMLFAVFVYYVLGTALLAPLVAEPARFVGDIFFTMPAVVFVAFHLIVGSAKYFGGGVDSRWERIERGRDV
jgi:hypothetical protein